MFTLLSGLFYPHLESALVETIQQVKGEDPRAPLAVIVPSEALRRRVQWLVCAEHACSLFDLQFLTFHQFALQLHAERHALGPPDPQQNSWELVGDFFYEYLLGVLLKQGGESVSSFARLENSSGLRQALWRSLRDLQEAQVEPSFALRAVEEGLFDAVATERLRGVFHLQAALTDLSRSAGVGLPEDLAHSVIPWVPSSPLLARLSTVIYYGFYDITQVQLSLLEEVARTCSVKIFFPLAAQPAYRFARQFFDRHLLKAGVVHQPLTPLPGTHPSFHTSQQSPVPPEMQVVNVTGEQGELTFACKAILHAVEMTGQAFVDIGVVARNLEAYIPFLRRIFDEHQIPFVTTAIVPILEEPAAKVWWQLAGLKKDQYPWRNLLNIVSSPWYRGVQDHGRSIKGQEHVWSRLIRHLRIVRGREDWGRLTAAAADPSFVQDWQPQHSGSPGEASDALRVFAGAVDHLIADCEALPESGSIGELTQAFEEFARAHLFLPDEEIPSDTAEREDEHLKNMRHGWEQGMRLVRQLDRVGGPVTWSQWGEVYQRALETLRMPVPGQSPIGVRVFDAMAARGHVFQTVFVLGMNDKIFPRVVREDAFLRDRDRRILSEGLGYKIDEKMNGFDEEALLFTLLRDSARHRVYLLYQRADSQGRPLLPSSLLACGADGDAGPKPEISVPLRLADRVMVPFYSPGGETLQESRLRALFQGRLIYTNGHMDWPASPEWWEILRHGLHAVPALEGSSPGAGPFDGIIDREEPVQWEEVLARGISPTGLERYAQCPFRYWMEHVLKTRDYREPFSRDIPNRVWGELGHAIFRRVYECLADRGWPASPIENGRRDAVILSSVTQVSDEYAARFGTGYLLLWERMKTHLAFAVRVMVDHDQQEYAAYAIAPEAFEVEAEGEVPQEISGHSSFIKIRGRLDRVDRQQEDIRRIVDYKFSSGQTLQANEPDLIAEALQGRRLQPPLYSFMSPASGQAAGPASSPHSVEFRYIRPLCPDPLRISSFAGSTWEGPLGDQLLRTIHRWLHGLRAGQFFVLPGPYCRGCQWSVACRSQHHASWVRAYGHPWAKEFRQLRKQRAAHE